jgi:diguanylate cyclase (GGDEF)-like protein
MVWFGLEATDIELGAGLLVLAACCVLPMVLIGAPAYPVSWGHAVLLTLVGVTVAISLRAVVRELGMLAQRFAQEAVVDDLTGLLNRRGWRYTAPRELARAARSGNPITLVTLDLDNFKELNDELGHEQGDHALRDTAERIRATLRAGDVVARLGGDEFVALLTNSTLTGSLAAIDRLREATPKREAFSSGIAVWDRKEDLAELMRRSDLALYAAKDAGGGCTEVAPPILEPLPEITFRWSHDAGDEDGEADEHAAAG